jgi:hypothetical protein
MKKFTSPGGAQRFLAAFSGISPHFRPHRHRLTASVDRHEMGIRFATWNEVVGLPTTQPHQGQNSPVTPNPVNLTMPMDIRRRGLSPDQIDAAIRLYDIGWSLTRIGEHLSVHPTTVLNRLRERNIPPKTPTGDPDLEQIGAVTKPGPPFLGPVSPRYAFCR